MARIVDVFEDIATDYARKKRDAARAEADRIAREAREEEQRSLSAAHAAEEAGRRASARQHTVKAIEAGTQAAAAEHAVVATSAPAKATTASGVTARATPVWSFKVVDYDKIPLDKLRPYLKRVDVEVALKMAVKMGLREMAGVEIKEDVKAGFR